MTAKQTAPVTVGTGKAVHLAEIDPTYGPAVNCGAVRYRNITTRTITRQPAGTEITCTKCLKAAGQAAPVAEAVSAPVADPSAYLPGETPMQRKRRLGLIAN